MDLQYFKVYQGCSRISQRFPTFDKRQIDVTLLTRERDREKGRERATTSLIGIIT